MKKLLLLVIILAAVLSVALYGCNKENDSLLVEYKDGTTLISRSFVSGGKVNEISAPAKSGYIFKGWYADSALTTPFDFNKKYKESVTIYAKYESNNVKVTFKADGSVVSEISLPYGGTLQNIPAVPEKNGTFGAWSRTDFSNITEDIIVEAVYTPAVNVVFKDGETVLETRKIVKGSELKVDDFFHAPAREGYTLHWEIGGARVTSDISAVNENLEIALVYTIIKVKVTFVFEYEDISQSWEVFVDYGSNLAESQIPTLPEISYEEEAVWESFRSENLKEDFTVNAIIRGAVCRIYFTYGDFSAMREVFYGETLAETDIPDFPDISDLEENERNRNFRWDDGFTDLSQPITNREISLTIHYDVAIKVTVNLDLDGAVLPEGFPFSEGENDEVIAGYYYSELIPTANGYRFTGWVDENGVPVSLGFIENDATFIATWEEIFCEVHFGPVEGVTFIHSYTQPIPYNTEISFSITTDGVNIIAVYANGVKLTSDGGEYTVTVTEDTEIAVEKEGCSVHTLTFYDGETLIATRSVTHGNHLSAVPQLRLSEIYAGCNWVTDEVIFDFASTPITADTAFYAEYIYKNYNIFYYINGTSSLSQSVRYGEDFTFITPIGLDGTLFFGWYYELEPLWQTLASPAEIALLGKDINLYARIIDLQDYSDHTILGEWANENSILVFHANGLLKVYSKDKYYEYGYMIGDGNVNVAGEDLYFDDVNMTISFRGSTFEKAAEAVIIYYFELGEYMVYTGTEVIHAGYWYLDANHTQPFTGEIDESLLNGKVLTLYSSAQRRVKINYNANGGAITQTGSEVFVVYEGSVSGDFAVADLNGRLFDCWVDVSGEIIDLTYIFMTDGIVLDAFARYKPVENSASTIRGVYKTSIEGGILLAEFSEDGYRFYRIIEDKVFRTPVYRCYQNGSGLVDENGDAITVEGGVITVKYLGHTMAFSEYENLPPANKLYSREIEGVIENLVFLENGTLTLSGIKGALNYYKISDTVYLAYYQSAGMIRTVLIDLTEWTVQSDSLPAEMVGDFMGDGSIFELPKIYVSITEGGMMTFSDGDEMEMSSLLYKITETLYGCVEAALDYLTFKLDGGKVVMVLTFSEVPDEIELERI